MTEELEQLLKNLKLRRMLEIYDEQLRAADKDDIDRKSTRLNSSHRGISYAVFCFKKTLEMAVEGVDVSPFRQRPDTARFQGRHRGVGLANFSERTGYGSPVFVASGRAITPSWQSPILSVAPS